MPTRKPSSNVENVQSAKDLKLSANAQSQNEQSSASSEPESHPSHNLLDELVNAFLDDDQSLDEEDEQGLQVKQKSNWVIHSQRHSQLLMAVVEPGSFILRYANDYFCSMVGIAGTYSDLKTREIRLSELLPDLKGTAVESLYRQHVLHLVLRDIYKIIVPR